MWCIPAVNADYVAAMEDVLELYAEPPDPKRPVVCFDEVNKQLISHTRPPQSVRPGRAARYDYAYQRHGTCNLFMFLNAHAGWRHVALTARRTSRDFAQQLKWLVDECYPDAERIRVVLDNLGSHRLAVLYESFPPAEARRLARKLEFHHTPKHASWLNMAELEISVFQRQCWQQPFAEADHLQRETAVLEAERNAAHATVRWAFTCQDARTRFQHHYPSTLP
jgi:hypothetical protein